MSIQKEDIPYELQNLADIVGIENYLKICKMYGGGVIYIPVYNKATMNQRNRNIIRDFNGKNLDTLRVRYNISANQIKKIIKKYNS